MRGADHPGSPQERVFDRHFAEGAAERARVFKPIRGGLLQTPHHDRIEVSDRRITLAREGRGRLGTDVHCREDRLQHRCSTEWVSSGEHLIEHDACGEHVGARIDRLAARLFRRDVARSSEDGPVFGAEARRRDLLRCRPRHELPFGDPEVEQLHPPVAPNHDV